MRYFVLTLLLSLVVTFAEGARAQTPFPSLPAPATTRETATASPTPAPPPPIPADFASPEASLQAFVSLMAQGGTLRPGPWTQARTHLDLSALPTVVREERGLMLSRQLYAILETAQLDLNDLKWVVGESAVTVYRQPTGDSVVLERQLDGRWLVSDQTVAAIPQMYSLLTSKGRIQVRRIAALDFEFLGLHGEQWMGLLLLPLLSYLAGILFVAVTRAATSRLMRRLELLEAFSRRSALKPLGWAVATLIFWAGLPSLGLPNALLVVLIVLVKVVSSIALIKAAFRFSDAFSDYAAAHAAQTSSKFDDMLIPLARRTLKVTIGVMGLLFLAQNLDIEVWSLFAGFSIFGAMVALAGQDMVKNIFGSVTVFTDQPFRIGDTIKVEGIEGVIEDVGFRSTKMRSATGSLITLPNSRLITASVDNMGHKPFKQLTRQLKVPWSTPPEKLESFCEGIRELVRRHPYTRKTGYQVWVTDLSEEALEVLIDVFWTVPDAATEHREKHRFLIDLHRLAAELDIRFAFPAQRVVLSEDEPVAPSDFTLEQQLASASAGRSLSRRLVDASMPGDPPLRALPGQGLVALGDD